jgi:hypothetical protein
MLPKCRMPNVFGQPLMMLVWSLPPFIWRIAFSKFLQYARRETFVNNIVGPVSRLPPDASCLAGCTASREDQTSSGRIHRGSYFCKGR